MQMLNVVKFKISDFCKLFNGIGKSQAVRALFAPFDDAAEFYCMDIKNIGFNNSGDRNYVNSPLEVISGHGGGIFIFFSEIEMEILCIEYSKNFYTQGKSGNASTLRYVNNNNNSIKNYFSQVSKKFPYLTYEKYINNYAILFLCLKPKKKNNSTNPNKPSSSSPNNPQEDKFETDLKCLRDRLRVLLKPTINGTRNDTSSESISSFIE